MSVVVHEAHVCHVTAVGAVFVAWGLWSIKCVGRLYMTYRGLLHYIVRLSFKYTNKCQLKSNHINFTCAD